MRVIEVLVYLKMFNENEVVAAIAKEQLRAPVSKIIFSASSEKFGWRQKRPRAYWWSTCGD